MLHMRKTAGVTGAPFLVVLDTDAVDNHGDVVGRVLWFDLRHEFPDRHPDTGTPFTVLGQFITDHYASTFMAGSDHAGLILWGTADSWRVDSERLRGVREWVATCYSTEGREVPQERPWAELNLPQH
jgi:hypothetical protein